MTREEFIEQVYIYCKLKGKSVFYTNYYNTFREIDIEKYKEEKDLSICIHLGESGIVFSYIEDLGNSLYTLVKVNDRNIFQSFSDRDMIFYERSYDMISGTLFKEYDELFEVITTLNFNIPDVYV